MVKLIEPFTKLLPEGILTGEVMLIEGDPSTGMDLIVLGLIMNFSNFKVVHVEFGDRVSLKLNMLLKLAGKNEIFSELVERIKGNTVILRFSNFALEFEDFKIENLPFESLASSISKFYRFVKENSLDEAIFIFSGFEEGILMWDVFELLKKIASLKTALAEATFIILIDQRSFDSFTLSLIEGISTSIIKLESRIESNKIIRNAYLIKSLHSTVSEGVEYSLEDLLKVD